MAKQKFYVVWRGQAPGIYNTWAECERQVKGVNGARFKSFDTLQQAQEAYEHAEEWLQSQPRRQADRAAKPAWIDHADDPATDSPELNALAVDAACSGNPGRMEYQGVYVATGQQIFHFGPLYGTNNVGEFLAIVHGLGYLKNHNLDLPIYSDSRNAMSWVRQKKCRTKLPRNARTEQLFQLIERAEKWLRENTYTTRIMKWDKDRWGETPADFGRK